MSVCGSRLKIAGLAVALTVALIGLLIPVQDAAACTVCFNGEVDPLAGALNGMIIAMMGPLFLVLAAFIAFMVYLVRKAHRPMPEHEFLSRALMEEQQLQKHD